MYTTVFIDERVEVSAKEMNDVRSMDMIKDMLTVKLKQNEGKCNANGYVKPGSIQLLARSMGIAENGKFTANWIYDCKVSCEVLKPVAYDPKDSNNEAAILTAKIIKINKMGVYAVFEEAIRVLLPRDLHAGDPAFDALKENDVIRVQMDKHRFQTNDAYIMAVGTLREEAGTRRRNVNGAATAATASAATASATGSAAAATAAATGSATGSATVVTGVEERKEEADADEEAADEDEEEEADE